ncbi:MAG: S-layer homology domain-containing protein, partial [Solibacillus isronensis]
FAVAVYNTLKANGQITASEAPAYMDDAKISAHAKEAVASLKAAGIMTGIDNEFNPKQSLTRAQAAVVLNKIVD